MCVRVRVKKVVLFYNHDAVRNAQSYLQPFNLNCVELLGQKIYLSMTGVFFKIMDG